MSDSEWEDGGDQRLIIRAKDTAFMPFRAAISKPARRTYIGTALFILTGFLLAGIAITAYISFYISYIPTRGFSRPIHLQFIPDHNPYGIVSGISEKLVSGQPYDISVSLTLPRTPLNQQTGNFMLLLQMLGPMAGLGSLMGSDIPGVVVEERRSAILTYRSPLTEYAHKLLHLPWLVLGWQWEAETLKVTMMERVEFARGWRNVPQSARVEIQSLERMQIYNAKLLFTAKLQGLRYFMYKYRIISFIVFTSTFWAVEMSFTLVVWFVLSTFIISGPETTEPKHEGPTDDTTKIKKEGEDADDRIDAISDTSRTFPTSSRQPPLRYSSPNVKEEEEDKGPLDIPQVTVDADDEDEDADFVLDKPGRPTVNSDSGIGTSMESTAGRRDPIRKRRSRGFDI
ncbi:hypothetical protein M501DRAFT_994219 [Patellaria atrata CBS 101060]|uniref:Adipose-regulatory protein-domain-containing protein n=1 Tax=Patellaria atrata CBS 101060 TaxID=1346257 RepID=A0A9P4SIJ6_9PEZI|nr:hypothetical protein M501DRAFT_994219 [Patellaria atrata CBS 101060]